jgi:hypothetical protein
MNLGTHLNALHSREKADFCDECFRTSDEFKAALDKRRLRSRASMLPRLLRNLGDGLRLLLGL